MRDSFHVATIFGIDITIDSSWILIFLLVTFNLALGVFPTFHPEWGFFLTWGIALIASFLFFSSVLAHELAHSLVAKARGLQVSRITLFLFGGVSNIEREPPSPATEFLMAIVGPITSIVLGVFFLFLASLASGVSFIALGLPQNVLALNSIATLFLWLGPVNILLGFFNLVPGFPLDGGRILRSTIWAITGSLHRATAIASTIGQIVAWTFIFTGVAMAFGISIPVLGSGLIGGLWLAFIGWFLNSAAQQSMQQVVLQEALEDVKVASLMRENMHVVPADLSLSRLVDDYMIGTDKHVFPVIENGELKGLVCQEDLQKVERQDWEKKRVKDVMTPFKDLDVVSPKEAVADAVYKIVRKDVGQVPVVEGRKLLGFLTRKDILLWLRLHSRGLQISS